MHCGLDLQGRCSFDLPQVESAAAAEGWSVDPPTRSSQMALHYLHRQRELHCGPHAPPRLVVLHHRQCSSHAPPRLATPRGEGASLLGTNHRQKITPQCHSLGLLGVATLAPVQGRKAAVCRSDAPAEPVAGHQGGSQQWILLQHQSKHVSERQHYRCQHRSWEPKEQLSLPGLQNTVHSHRQCPLWKEGGAVHGSVHKSDPKELRCQGVALAEGAASLQEERLMLVQVDGGHRGSACGPQTH